MPTLKIDGKEITVEKGTSVLQAALDHGIDIPHYCYHPSLNIAGSCRLCLVEIERMPKLVPSCATQAVDGMVVTTNSEKVDDARKSILEFLLINHPLDCPICDKAGECKLQDYTFQYGSAHSRFVEDKRRRATKDLGGNILLYRNRCVLCTRCVRFYEDVVGEPYLTVEHRGYHSDISIFPGKELTNKMTGNIVEICPVGCLIDKDFLFHSRVWNLAKTKSICPGCSTGCNMDIEHKDNKIYRIRSRENMTVNRHWLCDYGRYLYHQYDEMDRFTTPLKRTSDKLNKSGWDEARSIIHDRLALLKRSKEIGKMAVVGSAFASNEENYLLYKVFHDELGCDKFFVHQPAIEGEDEVFKGGFTIHTDKSPNQNGANLILGKKTDFWRAIKKGQIDILIFFGKDLALTLSDQQKELLKKLDFIVVFDHTLNDLAQHANVALPVTYFAEQDGSYLNAGMRLQKFQAALTPPDQVLPGWQILLSIYKAFNEDVKMVTVSDIMNDMSRNIKKLNGISFFKVGDEGVQIK